MAGRYFENICGTYLSFMYGGDYITAKDSGSKLASQLLLQTT